MAIPHDRYNRASLVHQAAQGAVQQSGQKRGEFEQVIHAAMDRPSSEPWLDSLCYSAGPSRPLLADERGCYGVDDRTTVPAHPDGYLVSPQLNWSDHLSSRGEWPVVKAEGSLS